MNLPSLNIRCFSSDQSDLDKCFYSNHYQLKGHKQEEEFPVIVDIGAGAGYFSFATWAFGAKTIFAVEPYSPNFKQLLKNTESIPYINCYNLGIYTKEDLINFNHPEIQDAIFYDFSNINIENGKEGVVNKVVTLDTFLDDYVRMRVDVLKISIGYAEIEILESSTLNNVESICGEATGVSPEQAEQFKNKMREKGFNEFYVAKNADEENKITFLLSRSNIEKHFNVKNKK